MAVLGQLVVGVVEVGRSRRVEKTSFRSFTRGHKGPIALHVLRRKCVSNNSYTSSWSCCHAGVLTSIESIPTSLLDLGLEI